MECTINWVKESGMVFAAETGSGHLLTMDGAADGGGRNLAPRPMETVLAGTGGCTAYDVVLILQRGRHDVRGCQVRLSAERAIAMSHDKYCSATIMLGRTAAITTSFELTDA